MKHYNIVTVGPQYDLIVSKNHEISYLHELKWYLTCMCRCLCFWRKTINMHFIKYSISLIGSSSPIKTFLYAVCTAHYFLYKHWKKESQSQSKQIVTAANWLTDWVIQLLHNVYSVVFGVMRTYKWNANWPKIYNGNVSKWVQTTKYNI